MDRELQSLGRYSLVRPLGKGTVSRVYEGLDPRTNRRVAVKAIFKAHLPKDAINDYSIRFRHEAATAAGFNHPYRGAVNRCALLHVARTDHRRRNRPAHGHFFCRDCSLSTSY